MLGLVICQTNTYNVRGMHADSTKKGGQTNMKNYKTERVTVRLSPEQLTQIDALAEKIDVDRSKALRIAIVLGLWHLPKDIKKDDATAIASSFTNDTPAE